MPLIRTSERADPCSVEDAAAGGQEDLVLDPAAGQVGGGAHQDLPSQNQRIPSGTTQDRVLHHDAALAQLHWPTLGGEHRAEQHPAPGPHAHVPAQRGGRSNIGRGVDLRRTTLMSDQHGRDHAAPWGAGAHHFTRQDPRRAWLSTDRLGFVLLLVFSTSGHGVGEAVNALTSWANSVRCRSVSVA